MPRSRDLLLGIGGGGACAFLAVASFAFADIHAPLGTGVFQVLGLVFLAGAFACLAAPFVPLRQARAKRVRAPR